MKIKKMGGRFGAASEFENSDETSGRIKNRLFLRKFFWRRVGVKNRFKNHNASSSLNRVEKKLKS